MGWRIDFATQEGAVGFERAVYKENSPARRPGRTKEGGKVYISNTVFLRKMFRGCK